ncbi:titin-like isoform X2 [Patiria miniata]|uniref:Cordon-bleu ubiquitin-like domain-containing protein n=1 Tax=Patiria miniata TaxID=46514 RepID=A0A914A1R5_PATMI|nr:titin-like isoform X2 [Patiria miniata]
MSTETSSKISTHQPSKRSRAPPPPTKKPSFEENKNGSLSEQEKDVLKKNGSLEDAGGTSSGDERQLSVVLPSEKIVKASVKKDTPILELLIMIASKNKLNPTNHTIAQPAARPKDPPVQLKPTQKLTDVVGDTIYIIRRNQKQVFVYKKDEKKSAVYEPTTRITVISGKNHKMCLRVDPEKTLQELLPVICDERAVETSSHTLRLTSQPQESLDMSQTLERTGAIEFLLVDLKGQPAGYEGGEVELMPEQRKKKGSIFGKFSKKKKGYALGGGEFQEDPASHVAAPAETHQRSRRHTSPSAFPPLDGQAQSATQEDEEGNNTLKKRRPAPPPPPGKHLTSASDDEKLDEESGGSNTLRKRRAPAPPRPRSPPRRTVSVGADSAHQISANLPPPRPVSPPVRTSINGETHLVRETIKEDKPSRPPKPPRPTSIIRGTSLETPPPTTEPPEPVFVPPPPPDLPPSPSDPQEDVTKLIEEGRLNQSFDEDLMDQEAREEIVDKKGEPSAESPRQDSMGVEVIVAGLTLETKAERHKEGAELREPEEEANPEEETIDEVSSEDIKEKALQASNSSHANSNNDHGDRDLINHMAETVPATRLKKLTQKRPVKVYAVYDETAARDGHSVPAEGAVVRRLRAKSDSSVLEVPLRVRSGRSLSVLEKAKPLEGLKLSCIQESIDLTETPSVAIATTSSESASCPSTMVTTTDQYVAISQSHETSSSDVTPAQDLHDEKQTSSTADKYSSLSPWSTDKDAKAKMELLSHMMKMSLDEDSKDTNDYPPHTQADDTHDMLEEKSVHALAFEVTREATIDYEDADKSVEALGEETEDVAEVEESQKKVDDEKTESAQMTVEKKEKVDESPTKVEDEKQSPVIAPGGVAMQKLNEQYATLQEQLTALQKQMAMPQQAGIMEIQMQQLQQQILLQQQIISQMMMSPQPMVMPLPYQQPVISPQQQMMLTPQQMMSPQQQMMSQQMISPQQQMMTQQMLSPQQQMMMSPQQLLMTPPMMYPQVSPVSQNITQPKMYAQQITSTATVQAQSTPISSTLELNVSTESAQDDASPIQDDGSPSKDDVSPSKDDGSPSGDDGSPSKHDDVPTEDDLPIVDNVVTSEVDTSEVQAEPRPLSPPVKADEVSVGHPTYHFARSRDVPQGEIKVVKASPPNTLRGPKQHQRPTLLQTPEPSEKKEETEPETKDHSNIDAKTNNAADEVHAEVDANHNPTPEGNGIEDKVDASKTEDKDDASKTEDKVHASKTEDKDDASKTEDKDDASKLEDKVHASKTEDKVHASKTEDKNASEETSSISAFAVAESTEPVSSSKPKSPKQKKSGFSLFKKKTPKYSYILSAQKEFSRKSETERQRTTSNPPKPTDLKSEGGQGNRGRAHTLDSYDPSKASCGVNFDPGQAECQREMAKNVHIPPNLAMSTSEINPSNDQPVIPPRSSKSKTTDTKVIVAKSFPQEMTTGSPCACPSTTVTNTARLSNISPINTIPVSSSDEMSSMTKPTPRHRTVSSPVESKTREQTVNKSPKSQPSPSHQVIPEHPSEKCSPLSSQSPEVVSLNSPGDSPIPPVRKMHSKPNDTCKTQVIGIEVRPERAATEGALYERRARIHNYRSEEEEQAKVKGDASVSQLRQIFGQGNP